MSDFKVCRFWVMVMLGLVYFFLDIETASLWTKCQTALNSSKIAYSCPVTDESYALRAQQMNCESYEPCDGKRCVYHCAINQWGNATMEVCAPETLITDRYCPHFSTGVGRMFEHYDYPCKECPFNYKSTRAYQYESCKNILKKIENLKRDFTSTSSRKERLFKKSNLPAGTASSKAAVKNAEDLNLRSGSIEIVIAASVLGCLALLILVIVGAVSYKKGKILTSEEEHELENSIKSNCPEKENCLQKNSIGEKKDCR